jgi:hypothetical protein
MADYTSTTSMPAWAQPYAQGYLERAQQTADQPYQQYQGPRVAGFTPWQQQGLQAQAQRAADGSPLMDGASGALQGMYGQPQRGAAANTAGPVTPQANPYAGASNPYLTQQIDAAQGDMVRNWNTVQAPQFDTAMSRSGSPNNAGVAQAAGFAASDLQRNMGRVAGDMRMQDYTQQQQLAEAAAQRNMQAQQFNSQMGESFAGRQDSMYSSGQGRLLQALGLAPQFAQQDYNDIDRLTQAGTAFQGQQQREMDSNLQTFNESRDYPVRQLDIFGRALGQAVGNNSSTTQSQPDPSALGQAVGGALTFAQLMKMIGG